MSFEDYSNLNEQFDEVVKKNLYITDHEINFELIINDQSFEI